MSSIVVEDVGPCKKRLKIEVPKEKIAEALEKSYGELTQTITLPGFRRGHVPRKLLEKRFGKKIEEDLKETLIQESFQEAVSEKALQPLGRPEVQNVEYDPQAALRFEVTLDIKPEFSLPEYKGIRVERRPIRVPDAEIDESLDRARRERARLEDAGAGAKAQVEDALEASLDLAADGATVHKVEKIHLHLAAEGEIIPGLETPGLAGKLIGLAAGSDAEVAVTYPADFFVEAARGKAGSVKIAVKAVKRLAVPEATEEWAKEMGFDSLEALRDEIRQTLFREKEKEETARLEEALLDEVLAKTALDLPADIVQKEVDDILIRRKLRLKYAGRKDEEIAKDLERLQAESRGSVERSLKHYFILDKVAAEQKIFATEEDVEERIARMAQNYGKSAEEMREQIEKSDTLPQLRAEIRADKARSFLRENAEVVGEAV